MSLVFSLDLRPSPRAVLPSDEEVVLGGSLRRTLTLLTDLYHVISADQEREKAAREIKAFLDEI